MNASILFVASGLLTLAAATIIWRDALRGNMHANADHIATAPANGIAGIMFVVIILNIWAIHLLGSLSEVGINFSLATATAVLTLIVHLIYTSGILRHGIQGLGLFLLPATGLPLLLIPILPEAHTANWVLTSSLLETSHLLISIIAYAILTLATLHAVMHLVLDRALKKRRLSLMLQALPPLVDVERHMFAQVKIATILIAVSILTGLTWQWVEYDHFALFTHKVLLALFTLALLILLQFKRYQASWPASTASRAVIGAYLLLALAYFGVKLIDSLLY